MTRTCTTSTISRAAACIPFSFLLSLCLFLTLSSLVSPEVMYGAQVTLAWDPVSASGLAGYKVHYGTVSKSYSFTADAGNQTTATITGLQAGTTYYFAITAYGTTGTESGYSNEVAYTARSSCSYAITPGSASVAIAGGKGSVSVTAAGTCSWTTPNPASWVTITSGASGTGNGTVTYAVSANTGSGSRTTALTIAGAAFTITQAGIPAYTITASVAPGGSISPSGGVSVNAGASQSFTFTPASGYRVAAVTVDGASVGAVNSYTFSNVTANHTISATYTAANYTLIVSTAGAESATVITSPPGTSFAAGTVVSLQVITWWNTLFSGWSGACSGTERLCTITMNSDANVTATFSLP